ncbi:MAG: 6-hydroxymethylpterin diphosphokinase MptE-like protein [Spirochaetota bacterium]
MSEHIFHRNLLALAARNPGLGSRLVDVESDPRVSFRRSRTGSLVPVFNSAGREISLHSLIDPDREADRVALAQPPGGFLVALGLGAGYGLKPYLKSASTSGVLLIEYNAALLRAFLEEIDLSELLVDARISVLLDPGPGEIETALLSAYVPPLSGDLRTLPLRARTDLDPELFGGATDAVRGVLGRISDDYSVQAFFGKLWYRNAVRNLFAAERSSPPIKPARRAVITAAGPSLELGLAALVKAKGEGAIVIATDTSLPALLGNGIRPDAVVSIDCQAISYYHFLKGIPPGIPLVLDLASPNRLARLSASVRFFSSGHPFCAFLSSRWRPFPALDTSGGNVTHAALSLAEALGAENALLLGADFSYPDGKSYARGTYIYDYFGKSDSRLSPLEALFSGFVFRTPSVIRESDRDSEGQPYFRYVTKPLMAYREHLERFAASAPIAVSPFRGRGVEIRIEARSRSSSRSRPLFVAGPATESASAFLRKYAAQLRSLPRPYEPAASYLGSLDPASRDLWMTLLPSASAFQRSAGLDRMPSTRLLETTRDWALLEIEEALDMA